MAEQLGTGPVDGNTIPGALVVEGPLSGNGGPITVTGARDETEGALANLLTALATAGIIVNSTTAT